MKVWLLIVMFNSATEDKVAVFKTEKECEISKSVTQTVIGHHNDLKSIECVSGTLKGDEFVSDGK
jgi:hypothetical protein